MQDQESAYANFGSRFAAGKAAANRGSFSRFRDEGGDRMAQFAGQLNNTFSPPSSTNAVEETAYGDDQSGRVTGQWGEGVSRVASGQSQLASMGLNAAFNLQGAQQAKEMAQLHAQSASQQGTFSAISSGLSALGSLGGFAKSNGWLDSGKSKASGTTYTLPSASWKTGSGRYF